MTSDDFAGLNNLSEFELGVGLQILRDLLYDNQIDDDTLAFIDNALSYWYDKYEEEINIIEGKQ